jgi:hypothetical protein
LRREKVVKVRLSAVEFARLGQLGEIVGRLDSVVGEKIIQRWLSERSTGEWTTDEQLFTTLRLLTTAERSRHRDLPVITEDDWRQTRRRLLNPP